MAISLLSACVLLEPASQNPCLDWDSRFVKLLFYEFDFGINLRNIAGIAFLHNEFIQGGVKCPEGFYNIQQLLLVILVLRRYVISLGGQAACIFSHIVSSFPLLYSRSTKSGLFFMCISYHNLC